MPNINELVRLVLFSISFTTVFARNDTILHGWHSESHERGTWSILWGCLATIFICTWSVLHQNVPPRSRSDLARFARRAKSTLLAIIAPELILASAIADTLDSLKIQKELNRHTDEKEGGEISTETWSLTHVRFMLAGGFVKHKKGDKVWNLIAQPVEVYNIPKEPTISKKELKSRSMTDWIANTLAMFQISWFAAQLLVRRIQHLHITAMEILTLAFIVCSILTFGFCWPQPQNVAYPIVLPPLRDTPRERPAIKTPKAPSNTASEDSPAFQTCLPKEEDRSNNGSHSLKHSPPDGPRAVDKSEEDQNLASGLSESLDRVLTISLVMLGFAGSVFGAVHCLAWNFTFPTPKERLAWRVCSVATTALSTFAVWIGTSEILPARGREMLEEEFKIGFVQAIVFSLVIIAYIPARLTLIALALASLRAVPADVFQTTNWGNIIPHIGS